MNTRVFTSAVTDVEGAHMVEFANNLLKTANFWLLVVGAFFIWAMTRYIPDIISSNCSNYKKEVSRSQVSQVYTKTTTTTTAIYRYRHRKIKRLSSKSNTNNSEGEGSSQDNINQSIKSQSQSKSAYANSTPDFVPLSASIQSAPPSPPHFKTPSRIVPTNYGSEIKLKLMTNEDKALRISNLREQHMKYRPTISSGLNPIRRCELGIRSSVGVLSSRYLADVRMDTGYSEDQRKNIIWAAGNRNEHSLKS